MLYPLSYEGVAILPAPRAVRRRRYQPAAPLPHNPAGPRSPARVAPRLRAVTSRPPRILVVDDDDAVRQIVSLNLEFEGFEVVTAVDGQDCLDQVRDVRPDAVVLDVMMPRLDGWATLDRLRADPATADLKVLMLSARAMEADLRRGDRAGVDAYMTKPFDPDVLVETLRRLLG